MHDANRWDSAKQILQEARRVLLLCHEHADADAINSTAAFAMWLLGQGVDFRFGYFGDLPETLFVLDSSFLLDAYVETNSTAIAPDAVVVLDTGDLHLLGEAQQLLAHFEAQSLPIICIDHHRSNKHFGTINIVEPGTAAACELLFDLFQDSPVEISPNMAHALLGGILGDTHNLSTGHVTPATLRAVAELMDLGADRVRIIERMPVIASISTARAWSQLLGSIQVAGPNAEIAYTVASKTMLAEHNLTYIKNMSSFMRDIGGVEVAMLFLEESDRQTKIEFRAKSQVDVSKIAEALGGGGHRGASGCRLSDMTIEEAITVALETVISHIDS